MVKKILLIGAILIVGIQQQLLAQICVGQSTSVSIPKNIGCGYGEGSAVSWDGPIGGTLIEGTGGATVTWTTSGTFRLKRTFPGGCATSVIYSQYYTVLASPATPALSEVNVNTTTACQATLTYSGSASETFWQTQVGGTDETYKTTRVVTASGTYYARTKNTSGCWSAARSVAVTIAIPATPGTTTVSADASVCGQVTLKYSGSATETFWQTTSTGVDETYKTNRVVTTNGTYYARTKGGPNCWSNARDITVSNITVGPTGGTLLVDGKVGGTFAGFVNKELVLSGYNNTISEYYYSDNGGTPVQVSNTTNRLPVLFANTGSSNLTREYWAVVARNGCTTTSSKVTFTVTPMSGGPEVPDVSYNCNAAGTGVILTSDKAEDRWYSTLSSTTPLNATNSITVALTPTSYYIERILKDGTPLRIPYQVDPTFAERCKNHLNYVKDYKPQVPLATLTTSETPSQVQKSISYFDGAGWGLEDVSIAGSPLSKDVVTPHVYDINGREYRQYLPYVSTAADGSFQPLSFTTTGNYTHNFYNTATDKIADDTRPFAETIYEASGLNRPLKQYGPGQLWSTNNKFVEFNYLLNVYSSAATDPARHERVIAWQLDAAGAPIRRVPFTNVIATGGYYMSSQLTIQVTKDERGYQVREYKNKEGQVILKKVQAVASPALDNQAHWAQTYYIYDDFGNLRFVLPPELSLLMLANDTAVPTQTQLNTWAFQYKYDNRKRMIEKRLPGAEPVYMVYDNRDRLVLTQDGNQRNATTKTWSFTKYDALNRPVLTGIITDPNANDRSTMQIAVDNYYDNLNTSQAWFETYKGSTGGVILGYDNKSYPPTTNEADYLTVTYYDKYDTYIAPAGYTYTTESLVDPETSLTQQTLAVTNTVKVKGLVTATRVKKLGSTIWLRTVNYYDQKYRVVQTISDHQKGKVTASNIVDFTGKVVYTKRRYVVNGTTRDIIENPHYDHMGRLLYMKHKVNTAPEVVLIKNEYNELGQLVDKKLHSTAIDGTGAKQSVDYLYNIRGWLTKVNEADVSSVASGDALNDYFGMELGYHQNIGGLSATVQYNGNISAIQWSKGNGGTLKKQAYLYAYDAMNRLTTATHRAIKSGAWVTDNAYNESIGSYDLNGNIKSLTRKGFKAVDMDVLSYDYTGNQLNYVNDAATGDMAAKGFVNANTTTDDYSYDFNGNLDKDKNKGINNKGDIKYNHLNLVTEVVKSTNEKVKYYYDATGRKLSQEVLNAAGTPIKTTDYIGEMVFENDVLQFINHAEGRVLPDGSNWEYQYHLKDHLGNVRVTFTTKAQTTTTNSTNFEAATNSNFQNYTNQTFDLVDHTDAAGTIYNKVQTLNGGANGRVGLAKSIAVMPGDEVTVSAYAKYMNLGTTSNTNTLITSLAAAFGLPPAPTGEQLKIYNGLNSYATSVPAGNHDTWALDDESAPKAFVTILFFDKDHNLLDAAWDQISTIGAQTSATVKQPPHDFLSITAKAPEAGYAYVFLSNEHPNYVDVYFDDATVSHTPSPIVSVSDYFPFGLTYNLSNNGNTNKNKYLFNGGSELQDDLGLDLYQTPNRMYTPQLGRFWGIDKLADAFPSITPMIYGYNNPVKFFDPLGLSGTDTTYVDENGGMLNEVVITASRLDDSYYDYLFLSQYAYSSNPIKRALASGYRNGGLNEVDRLWNRNKTIHIPGFYRESKWVKDFKRVAGAGVQYGVGGMLLLAAGSPMIVEELMAGAPTSLGERATASTMDFVSQMASNSFSFGDVDWIDVGASGIFGFNTFGNVLVSSNANFTLNGGITSDFGTAKGVVSTIGGMMAAGVNDGFIDPQVRGMYSKIALKLGVDWIIKVESNQINKSFGNE